MLAGSTRARQPAAPSALAFLRACSPFFLLVLAGCGGAMPLGHTAHVLNAGKTTIAAGVAGRIMAGVSASADDAGNGRLLQLAIAPDVSPWVSGRAGLGNGFEAGIGASTRSIRIDGRRAFGNESLALSVGVGASALMAARPTGGSGTSGVYGAGFDVPVLFGWRSSADLYGIWTGPRIGGELFGGQVDADSSTGEPVGANGKHLRFGWTLGLRAGLRHIYGVVEVEGAYHIAEGQLDKTSLAITTWSVTPAGALVVSF